MYLTLPNRQDGTKGLGGEVSNGAGETHHGLHVAAGFAMME
jgi:hypothetical protein